MSFTKIAIVGAGQIGTSLALAVASTYLKSSLVAYDTADLGPEFSRVREAAGIPRERVELTCDPMSLQGADLVVLATPVGSFRSAIANIAPFLNSSTVFTDVGSVKRLAQERIRAALDEYLGPKTSYVPFHILNGNAGAGPATAAASVFKAPGVIVPGQALPGTEARIAEFWASLGVTVFPMTADQHDLIFGTTSHLEHAIMFSLMDTPFVAEHLRQPLTDPGNWLHAMSRIAVAGPVMWADNFKDNGDKVLETGACFREYLKEISDLLDKDLPRMAEKVYRLSAYAKEMPSARVSAFAPEGAAPAELKMAAFLGVLSLAIGSNVRRIELKIRQHIAPIANPSLKDGMGPVAVDPASVVLLAQAHQQELGALVGEFLKSFDRTLSWIAEENREALMSLVARAGALRAALP